MYSVPKHPFLPFPTNSPKMFQTIRVGHALRGPHWVGADRMDAPPPAGWLHGDQVCMETGEVRRAPKQPPLIGILDLTNRTGYGFSSNGTPLYLFHPMDTRYPPMVVGSKAPKSANQFGVASLESWQPTKAKWPRGSLQGLLGPVGDNRVEQDALRRRVRVAPPKAPRDPTLKTGAGEEAIDSSYTFTDLIEWDVCLNIDPDGCRDVDDVLSWHRLENGNLEFAVTIADVAFLVPEGSAVDLVARQKAQTVYEEGRVLDPMLPAEISEGAGSLLADGQARQGITAVWVIQANDPRHAIGPFWRSARLVNKESFTYESILDKPEYCTIIKNSLSAVAGKDVGDDPHKWIEVAMVRYNAEAANVLRRVRGGILRRHMSPVTSHGNLEDIAAKTGCQDIAFLGASAGEYIPAAIQDSVCHFGLGESVYCHASSPLRRYADLANQRILKRVLFDPDFEFVDGWGGTEYPIFPDTTELSQDLNARAKAIKAFERDLWCMSHLTADGLTESEGIVLGWKPSRDDPCMLRLAVYVPEWKRTVRVSVCNHSEDSGGDEKVGISCGPAAPVWSVGAGQRVSVTAFCDLRAARWDDRFVFRVSASLSASLCRVQDNDKNDNKQESE